MFRLSCALSVAIVATLGFSALGFLTLPASGILGGLWGVASLILRSGKIVVATVSFVFALFLANGALSLFVLGSNGAFRGEEAINYPNSAEQVTTAIPGKTATLFVEYGDLAVMASRSGVPFAPEPRRLKFQIDSLGFRNDSEFQAQEWILLGDSMIFGASNDQEEMLSAVLERQFGIRAYNVAYAGHPRHYTELFSYFERKHPQAPRKRNVVVFFFEGNDFVDISELERWANLRKATPSEVHQGAVGKVSEIVLNYQQALMAESRRDTASWPSWLQALYTIRINLPIYRLSKASFQRTIVSRFVPSFGTDEVLGESVQGAPMLFYRPYYEVVRRDTVKSADLVHEALDKLAGRIAHVFFIPDKSRFYPEPGVTLPHAQWGALAEACKARGIDCSDLTTPFRDCARKLAQEGRLLFRRDDTHWAPAGIECAAHTVAATLKSQSGDPVHEATAQ